MTIPTTQNKKTPLKPDAVIVTVTDGAIPEKVGSQTQVCYSVILIHYSLLLVILILIVVITHFSHLSLII